MEEWISLNVGGKIFNTTVSTLTSCRDSVLYKMFNRDDDEINGNNNLINGGSGNSNKFQASRKDKNGAYLIDRDPVYFRCVLNYLRTQPSSPKDLIIDNDVSLKGVREEANFFQVVPLVELVDKLLTQQPDFTRKEILLYRSSIKLSKKKLYDLDLQDIDFGRENFSYSIISNCIFNGSIVSNCSFLHVVGEGVNFVKANVNNSNFSNSNLLGSNFSQSDLGHSSFNNCNLSNSVFEQSNCVGALFQRAHICNASFKNSNLEHAKFQKANLKGTDFTNSQIQNCHFTSADIRGCTFDWKNISFGLFKKAKVTQQQYDEIPLPNKHLLGFKILSDDLIIDKNNKNNNKNNNNNGSSININEITIEN